MIFSKRALVLVLILAIIGISTAVYIIQGQAQSDVTIDLTKRLTQEGIPVESITTESDSPRKIVVTIVSSSNNDKWAPEDFWNKHLTWREATLSYKYGQRLEAVTLIVVNSKGETMDWAQSFFSPEDRSQTPYPFNSSEPDDQIAAEHVKGNIDLRGLELDSVEVTTGVGSFDDVQMLKLDLVAPTLEAANDALPSFIPSLRPLLSKVNKQPGSRIAIVRLDLVDADGNFLLEYIWDLELSRETWHMAEGITGGWFSRPPDPLPTPTPSTVPEDNPTHTPITEPYPSPEEGGLDKSQPTAYP
ncbi:hypothetical protein ACFLZW_04860 [Chloroflexota bacterium]